MEYDFRLHFKYKELRKNPELVRRIKEISNNPNATNLMEKGDHLSVHYGLNIEIDAPNVGDNLDFFYNRDKKQFASFPTKMVRKQIAEVRDYCDTLDNFITKVEREQ